MPSPLIENMIQQYQYAELNESNLDAFLAEHEDVILFFTENPTRFPESNDVAMILPELVKAYGGRFQVGVIEQSAQRALQARYAFMEWPSLVFLRNAQFLGNISRVQDWSDYLNKINALIASEPKPNPGLGIPIDTPGASAV